MILGAYGRGYAQVATIPILAEVAPAYPLATTVTLGAVATVRAKQESDRIYREIGFLNTMMGRDPMAAKARAEELASSGLWTLGWESALVGLPATRGLLGRGNGQRFLGLPADFRNMTGVFRPRPPVGSLDFVRLGPDGGGIRLQATSDMLPSSASKVVEDLVTSTGLRPNFLALTHQEEIYKIGFPPAALKNPQVVDSVNAVLGRAGYETVEMYVKRYPNPNVPGLDVQSWLCVLRRCLR
jgi:hypothetical protein